MDKQMCPSGTFSAYVGSAMCSDCVEGKYSTIAGAVGCSKCQPGKYSASRGASSESTCIKCPADTYSPAYGAASSATCTPCEVGKSAVSGSNVGTNCTIDDSSLSTVTPSPSSPSTSEMKPFVVKLVLTLPLSLNAFTNDRQIDFKASLAAAAGVAAKDVTINGIRRVITRRVLSESVRVDVSIKAADKGAADTIVGGLTALRINKELAKVDLPAVAVHCIG